MSQRASSAAATATADVSEPPRPSVVMRLSGPMPWKPAITATWPCSMRLRSSVAIDFGDAGRAMDAIGLDRNLPAAPGARRNAHILQHDGQQPGRHLFAGGDDRVIFAGIMDGCGLAAPADQPVGRARHGRDHHRHLVAGLDFALDMARDIADAVDIRNRGAPELHHQTAHGQILHAPACRLPGAAPPVCCD